jgi:GT2 family glycosyltransferase
MLPLPLNLPRIAVSIVVYNSSLPLLQRTLDSLERTIEPSRDSGLGGLDVTIVDNGSPAAYGQALAELCDAFIQRDEFRLMVSSLPVNVGFGAGHNRALSQAAGEYYLVLNPDVEVAPDALALGCLRLRDSSDVVLISPHAVGADGRQEFLCKRRPSVLVLLLRAFLPKSGRRLFPAKMAAYEMSDVCVSDQDVTVPLASGCFMLARSAQLREIGGFDERYFLYFEDFDLSLRIGRLGQVIYMPQLHIVHHGGYAARKGWRHLQLFARSGLRFFRQHGWRWL